MGLINTLPGAIAQGTIWGIMAIGVYITYKILDFADLTVDGSITTGAAVCAVMVTSGCNVWVSMLCAMLAGALAGLLTGLFHTKMGIPGILAGILTQLILWSVNLKIMGKPNISLTSRNNFLAVTHLEKTRSILTLVAFCAVVVAVLYWFFGTERGCSVRATGCNMNMSRAQGINTNVNTIIGLMISNGLVALAGALLAQFQGASDINMGRGAIVIGLAAVIIGDAILSKARSRVFRNFATRLFGVILGAVIYYIVYQVVIFMGLDTDLLKMLSAIVVAIFLAVPYWKKQYFTKPKKGDGKNA